MDIKPKYVFASLQSEGESWKINEIIGGESVRTIISDSDEGKKLLKENLVKYPKNRPVIILDE